MLVSSISRQGKLKSQAARNSSFRPGRPNTSRRRSTVLRASPRGVNNSQDGKTPPERSPAFNPRVCRALRFARLTFPAVSQAFTACRPAARRSSFSSATTSASPTLHLVRGEISTPKLDRLASGGLRFTQFLERSVLLSDAGRPPDRRLSAPGRHGLDAAGSRLSLPGTRPKPLTRRVCECSHDYL